MKCGVFIICLATILKTCIAFAGPADYSYTPTVEYGAQDISKMGERDDWDKQGNQIHRVGPAVFGKFGLGDRHVIKYNAAWLVGSSDAAPDHTFRMQVEYEF